MALVADISVPMDQVARQCPKGVMADAIVRAARAFCRQTRWLRATIAKQTVVNEQTIALGTALQLEVIGVRAVSATRTINERPQTWALSAGDATTFDPNFPAGIPSRYAYLPEGQIYVGPKPDAVYDLTISAVVQPVQDATDISDALLAKWHRAIEFGTLEYLLSLPGTPWTNAVEADRNRRAFQSEINNARADEQRGYNAGSVRMRPRRFVL